MSVLSLNEGLTMESSPDGHAVLLKSHRSELIGAWITEGSAEDFIAEQKPKLFRHRLKLTGWALAAVLILTVGYGLISEGSNLGVFWGELLQHLWLLPLAGLILYIAVPVKEVDPPEETSVLLNAESYRKLTALAAKEKAEIFASQDSESRYGKIDELIALRLVRRALDQIT